MKLKIKDIQYLEEEKTINIEYAAKSIRLDVYVEESNRVFNLEMQATSQSELPYRSRYYQGMIDLNSIEKGEDYDELKGIVDGQYYIHFAIIKIRTGGGLPRNDSQVIGYDRLGYKTAREIGFTNGFPIPSIAGAIMKDIDVWGYYGNSTGEVTPTQVLGGETDDDMIKFYNELKFGRNYDEAEK